MAQPWALQRPRLSVEVTPGTATVTMKALGDIAIDADPNIPDTIVTPNGYLHPTDVILGKEKTTAGLSAEATCPQTLVYLFNSLLLTGAITTPGGGTLTRRHTFAPASAAVNAYKTYTVELGPDGTTAGRKFDYGTVTDLELTFVPDKGVGLKGTMIGREISTGVTVTASPTAIGQATIGPKTINCYAATTEAGLAAGQVRPLSVTLKIGKRYGDVYKLDSGETSFSLLVPSRTEATASVDWDHDDAETLATLTKLRASTQMFFQIIATGSIIEGILPHIVDISFPFKFKDPKFGNKQDILAQTTDLLITHYPTFNTVGGAFKAVIDTDVVAL